MEMRNRSSTSTVQELDRARQDLARLLMPLSAANQELRDKQSQEQLDKVLYCIVLYCIVLYCIVLYCIVLYCIVLYCIVLYCIVLFCFVLYCIVLFCRFCLLLTGAAHDTLDPFYRSRENTI